MPAASTCCGRWSSPRPGPLNWPGGTGGRRRRDAELLRAAHFAAPLPATLVADVERGVAARFPIAARDLMPRYTGAELGRRLGELERRWIASGFKLDREALLS